MSLINTNKMFAPYGDFRKGSKFFKKNSRYETYQGCDPHVDIFVYVDGKYIGFYDHEIVQMGRLINRDEC